jgi:hypothetical protein
MRLYVGAKKHIHIFKKKIVGEVCVPKASHTHVLSRLMKKKLHLQLINLTNPSSEHTVGHLLMNGNSLSLDAR